jgi:hypothetical protein
MEKIKDLSQKLHLSLIKKKQVALHSKKIWIIIGTAFLSAVGNGNYLGSFQGMVEGLSIICICIAMLIFKSISDYIKDKRFIHL